jgi:hypothetical protein
MAVTKIRGNTQIIAGTITNAEISASAAIATSKLADGANFLKKDGSVALTGNLDAGSNRITNLAAPVGANDAARKVDVDAAVAGLSVKMSCRAATTANVALANALEDGDTLDGVTLATGDRVLVKNQSTASQNGIYVVQATGAAVRATDFDESLEVTPNAFTFVQEGTVNADTGWVLITDNPITVGTTGLSFTQFSGASLTTTASNVGVGGVGVFKQKTGNDLEFRSINAEDSTITVTLDGPNNEIDLKVGATSLTNSHINASAAIARTKLASGSANHVLINDGSGVMSSEAVLAVSRGGTNSGATLSNNRFMVSSSGAIVEAAAVTANRALISDANGLPTHSAVTATELGYLAGVTSAVQTQLDARLEESKIVVREVPTGAVNGANADFDLAQAHIAGSESVYLNGLLQNAGGSNDYTIASSTITFNTAPASGDVVLVSYFRA